MVGPGLESWGLASLSRVYTDPGAEGAEPPSFPPGRAVRPTHLRGRQPRLHLPHQEGLQAAARGAEKPGARCRPRAGICLQRRHGGPRARPRGSGSRGLGRARRVPALPAVCAGAGGRGGARGQRAGRIPVGAGGAVPWEGWLGVSLVNCL